MSCDVCIPWRATPEREPIFHAVRTWWERNGFNVITADSGHAPFNRAASRNAAVALATTDEVIIADADTVPDLAAMHRAVELAREAVVYPFDRCASLAAEHARPYDLLHGVLPQLSASWYSHDSTGGVFAIHRATYWRLGGQDPGFTGWGFEDDAFYLVARELHQVIRLRADAYAFDHTEHRDWSVNNPGYGRLATYRRIAAEGRLEEFLEYRREREDGEGSQP